jgi:uncharacterized membrane protein YoaK (UPF0700 family)
MVDAVTYLAYGHVFAANMTGNVIVLGFALGGASDISAAASMVSLAAFIIGAGLSARVAAALEATRYRWLVTMLALETGMLTVGAVLTVWPRSGTIDLLVVGLLAVAMGMRTITVRRLGIADVSTTVLTSTLAALASDMLAQGMLFRGVGVRLLIVTAMLVGAAAGAAMIGGGATQVLVLAAGLLLLLTCGSYVATRVPWSHYLP